MSRRLLAVGSAIGLLLPLAACGGDDPVTKPSTSSSASASASPTESGAATAAPTPPEEAKKNTKAGVIAFARHYVSLYNHAQWSGDTAELSELGAKDCKSCNVVRTKINEIYGAGERFTGGEWTVTQAVAVKSGADTWVVTLGGRMAKSAVIEPDGDRREATGGPANANFYISRSDAGWQIDQWRRFS